MQRERGREPTCIAGRQRVIERDHSTLRVISAAVRSVNVSTPRRWGLTSVVSVVLLGLCTAPADSAQWYTINGTKGECERASRTDYPSPDDYMDDLQKQNQYRSREVTRDFAGRIQVVTVTDTGNRQMTFYADDDAASRPCDTSSELAAPGR
jgi:hypothetical protein